MKDIFGKEVNVGDRVAVGMSYMRSSVLRVGEVVSIKEKNLGYNSYYKMDCIRYSIRIKWTHNGSGEQQSYFEVKDSTILHENTHTFAKLLVLPPGFAEQFPSDVTQ